MSKSNPGLPWWAEGDRVTHLRDTHLKGTVQFVDDTKQTLVVKLDDQANLVTWKMALAVALSPSEDQPYSTA